jgi:hypothetical protein
MRSRLILSLVPAFVLLAACGDDAPNEFTTANNTAADSSGTATDTGAPADLPETGGQDTTTAGDGDGDPGDGDGDTGDGDGDTGLGVCGDGAIDIGEQCDGAELNGYTCADLGYASGELACDPVTCTYDASACVTEMDGGSGGGTSG